MSLPHLQFNKIWLADDDFDDCEIFEEALNKILPETILITIPNGDVLMKRLQNNLPPDFLFLDINMPCKDGIDCLKEIRAIRKLSRLPIVIFSSSTQPNHIENSYGFGATLYYSKPCSFSSLISGLSNLFKMNWNDPYTITSDHYINNKYVSYSPPS
jgi:DNA-binding NarL/FixJ family response regulator